ncbi:MAG: F0F1 ATP synthase subunit B [Patescibacteria group bacterium]|nr:F0F1 ATP synthase subunit B [Patescibacteria group bacterium]
MGELVTKLGLDWRLLLAQVVNFGILVAVLTWAVYKPLLKVMAERRGKIERGLSDAEKAAQQLKEFEGFKQEQLTAFKRQADAILAEASRLSDATKKEAAARATEQAAKIVQQAKVAIAAEKEQMLRDLQGELSDVVVAAAAKVIPGNLSSEQHRRLVEQAAGAITGQTK